MVSTSLYSSKSDEWETPQDLFDELDAEFHFNLDPCATKNNHKCEWWYDEKADGLKMSWGGGCRVWCNPPYSKVAQWVEKAFREGRKDNTVVVMLLPARTDTKYFHNFIYHRAEIRFIKGRLRFNDSEWNAPFPSMLVIYRGAYIDV